MKLATKLMLGIVVAAAIVFASATVVVVDRESATMRSATQRETLLLARTVQVAAENALRDEQPADVRETFQRLERTDPTVDMLVFGTDGTPIEFSEGGQLRPPESVLRDHLLQVGTAQDRWEPDRLLVGLPLRSDDGDLQGALVVVRPLEALHAEVAATRRELFVSGALYVLLTLVVVSVIVRLTVARPTAQLVHAIRLADTEDVRALLPVGRGDELGEIAREFRTMLGLLQEARQRLLDEAERRRRLERGLEQADKLIRIGELAAFVAHEVGSPLQVVSGRARSLMERPDVGPERVARTASIISEQADRVTAELSRLLDTARRPRRHLPVDLSALCAEIVDLLEPMAADGGVALELEPPPSPGPVVDADPGQLQQVLLNLVRNAVQVSPPKAAVTLRVVEESAHAGFEVEDRGPGIPEEDAASVFEPFFTTRFGQGGSGLGLAVVRGIVHAHRGRVTHASAVGGGTLFRVILPRRGAS